MPAKNLYRIDEKGIYAHIYNKGVEKRTIFNDEEDYEVFQGFLKDYLTAPKDPESNKKVFKVHGRIFRGTPHQPKNYLNKVELIAYTLIPDHFHLLLLQKTRGSLERFIRSLCTRYSMYFNKKYQRTGALFEGPYKSIQIKDEVQLSHLTGFLHHSRDNSSYPEYLGSRKTPWVKPQVVLSLFDKGTGGYKSEAFASSALDPGTIASSAYKDFVEKYELDQKEKDLIDGITFDSKTDHLERSTLASSQEIGTDPDLKVRSRIPEFLATSTVMFLLLVTLGVRNIQISTVSIAKNSQPLPTSVSDVLSETKETKPEMPPEAKTTVIVKTDDGSSSINIRQEATTSSRKIGQAKDGDSFEFVSKVLDWYEIKLADGVVGFISATYVVTSSPH